LIEGLMTEAATKADLAAADAALKAAIEAEKRRLTIQLGGVLILDLITAGFLLFATGLLLAP
jgi:hypothetical protein